MPAAETGLEKVELDAGPIGYRDSGSGPVIVFAHGLLVDGTLWRKVTPLLDSDFRCVAPDLPLGSHREPMRAGADLTPPGVARIVADFIEKLGLRGTRIELVAARAPNMRQHVLGVDPSLHPHRF